MKKMNKLKVLRLESNLSQLELATASGVSRWIIQLAENGIRNPTSDELELLGHTLGVTPEQIIGQSSGMTASEAVMGS